MPKPQKKNNQPPRKEASAALSRVQKNIYRQAGLAVLTLVLTLVIVFAMTSAWYTNIVQTSGLVFEAEAWGFDGTITVNEETITAAPGDEGIVHLEVANASDSITDISVNVSKAKMDPEMQKRMFFYVDTQLTRNGETMERVYLNNRESYTYTLFSQGKLTLTELLHNDSLIKWQWVYDMLGYYVLGEANETTGTVKEIEYLRPIEYDYDEAITVYETDAENNLSLVLTKVDDETTVKEFLETISAKDGYKGIIDTTKSIGGYYPVDVDEDGYGVYAYLCNYTEIELATRYDTTLGNNAYKLANGEALSAEEQEDLTFTAELTISAQKSESTAVNVSTLSGLQQAINMGNVDLIQLSDDINITSGNPLVIPANTKVMLDLNGKAIKSSNGVAINAQAGSSLTLINGAMVGTGSTATPLSDYAVYAVGAEVVLSDVDITDYKYGFYVGDSDDGNTLDSRVYMTGCTMDTSSYCVFVSGNGLTSTQKTQLVIEKSFLTSDGITISGNGTSTGNGRWGTDIQIINSTITSNLVNADGETLAPGVGIYQPQQESTLAIYNSTVSGYTGIAIKGGSVSITNSTIQGTGAKQEAKEYTSGFADTGDAVYIEANYDYEILLEIKETVDETTKAMGKTELISTNGYALQVFEPDSPNVAVKIYSGTFTQSDTLTLPANYIDAGSQLSGNTVSVKTTTE